MGIIDKAGSLIARKAEDGQDNPFFGESPDRYSGATPPEAGGMKHERAYAPMSRASGPAHATHERQSPSAPGTQWKVLPSASMWMKGVPPPKASRREVPPSAPRQRAHRGEGGGGALSESRKGLADGRKGLADGRKGLADGKERREDPGGGRSGGFLIDFAALRQAGFITPASRKSRLSEEFRLIKRRLMQRMTLSRARRRTQPPSAGGLHRSNRPPPGQGKGSAGREHVILVTSARPIEGRSYVAVNLALSIVLDEGFNVMLVDADTAHPAIAGIFGTDPERKGLTDLLSDNPPDLPLALLREKHLPLTLLSAGSSVASATELFGGEEMALLVDDIASRYPDRVIIFDAPPLLASTEPLVLSQHVGQILFVVDAQSTPRAAVTAALDLLDVDAPVSLVLNRSAAKGRIEQFGSYYDAYSGDA